MSSDWDLDSLPAFDPNQNYDQLSADDLNCIPSPRPMTPPGSPINYAPLFPVEEFDGGRVFAPSFDPEAVAATVQAVAEQRSAAAEERERVGHKRKRKGMVTKVERVDYVRPLPSHLARRCL